MHDGDRHDEFGPASPEWAEAAQAGFDQSPFSILVAEGPDLVVRAVNQPVLDAFGDRGLGAPLRQSYAELTGQQALEVYEACFRTGEVQRFSEWRFQLQGPDGEPVEVYLDFTGTPWFNDDGTVRGVVGTAQDVTEKALARIAAEEARDVAAQELADIRTVVMAMQGAHLPEALPVLPRLDVAARYLLAADDTASGGDWFDTVVRPDGSVALVVGDVVGHGTVASATMGQLRAVLHERLTSTATLEDVLVDVDRYARTSPDARAATVCVVELDPVTGQGRYATAGHPPPLVLDGELRYLEPTGGGPLATNGPAPVMPFRLESPEALLVLYTDGIVERPGTTPTASTVELATTVGDAALGRGLAHGGPARLTERVCEITIELLTRVTGYSDDITVLAAQRAQPPTGLAAEWVAHPAALADARQQVSDWLGAAHVRPVERLGALHAATELLANAASHAYVGRPDPGPMRLALDLTDAGLLRITVSDEGTWRTTEAGENAVSGGRGLSMSSSFLDTIELNRSPGGTTAVGTMRLTRPARLQSARPAMSLQPPAETPFAIVEEAGVVVVNGAVLQVEADELERTLRRASRAGTAPTLVDLAGVTHLGSAGIQALFLVAETDAITLRAPNGSVAQHVLDLVRLPHVR